MMGSAMCFPCRDNGHVTRLVGTEFDKDVIQRIKQDNFHPRLNCPLPEGVEAYQFEELSDALKGCDLLISGVPSFGVDWFAEKVLSRIPDDLVVLSLKRVEIAGLRLDERLKPGEWRDLTQQEIQLLKR